MSEVCTDRWALSRQAEAEARARKAASQEKFERFLNRFKVARPTALERYIDQWDRRVEQDMLAQQELVKALDTGDVAPFDDRPTPAEVYQSMKIQVANLGTALRNYFDPSYRRITWDQAIEALQGAGLVARLGGMGKDLIIVGGRSIVTGEDGQKYYDEPFTIEQQGNMWIAAKGIRTLYARNLDEVVKVTIQAFVRDEEAAKTEEAAATAA